MSPPVATATTHRAFSSFFFISQSPVFGKTTSPHRYPLSKHIFSPLCDAKVFLKSRLLHNHDSPLSRPHFALSTTSQGISVSGDDLSFHEDSTVDKELRTVLELATDSELYELEHILYGTSYFSPLLKSISKREDIDYYMIGVDPEEREHYICMLAKRFLYLAADAVSIVRFQRPSYRNVLLGVRKKLNVPCSTKLSTEDLEAEIFLHMLQEYTREEDRRFYSSKNDEIISDGNGPLERGLSQWKLQTAATLRVGAEELRSIILKGGGVFSLGKIHKLLGGKLSGAMFKEAAKYQLKKEALKKGAQFAAAKLESRVALLAAEEGLTVAAFNFLGLRAMMTFLNSMLWGIFVADVFKQMVGTDYARILRAIYALAQIRILRTYKSSNSD